MADEIITSEEIKVKKVTDLVENESISDDDLFIAGAGGGASLRKYKWSTVWDKIVAAIVGKLSANDLVTTVAGKLLDARQGKALNDKISELNTKSTVEIPTSTGNATLFRCGCMRIMDFKNFSASDASKLTLALSDRPAKQMEYTGIYYINSAFLPGLIRINADGTIVFFDNKSTYTTAISGIYACLVWIV